MIRRRLSVAPNATPRPSELATSQYCSLGISAKPLPRCVGFIVSQVTSNLFCRNYQRLQYWLIHLLEFEAVADQTASSHAPSTIWCVRKQYRDDKMLVLKSDHYYFACLVEPS
jgi:hypothetical protein